MLSITLTIDYTDGRNSQTVRALPVTQVAFEREHSCSIGVIATEQKLSHVYWLAWHAARPGVDFDAWLDAVESIDVEVDATDPTKPAAPAT